MSDFIPPNFGDDSGIGGSADSSLPPGSDYSFAGYFYVGDSQETCLGVWLRSELSDDYTNFNPTIDPSIENAIEQGLEGFSTALLGIERLIDSSDVPRDARRDATGYLTLGEAMERGARLPGGVAWNIYIRNGNYYLAVIGSG